VISIASIRTSGIIGDKFIKISAGGSDTYLEPGMEIIETEPSINLEELISKYIFESND
jgi:phospholipid/cholesterol/gamma-HCH transport system substrate-binding protein